MTFRNISIYIQRIKSKYYVSSNGDFFTEKSDSLYRFYVDGKRISCKNRILQMLNEMRENNEKFRYLDWIDNTSQSHQDNPHYLLSDGKIIRRMSQQIDSRTNRYFVYLNNVLDERERLCSHRIVAQCFLGNVEWKDVRHKDGNPLNNNINNLLILTPEEHRKLHSKLSSSTTIES